MIVGKATNEATRLLSQAPSSLAFATILAALALLLASCGGGDDGDDNTLSPSPTRRSSPTRASVASASASPVTTDIGMELDEFVIRPKQTRARPGTINFQINNAGEVAHEFVVIKSDLPIAQLPRLAGDTGVDENDLDVEGRLEDPLDAGADDELSLDLEVGQYVLICNLAPNGESHYLNGMYTRFEVRTDAPLSTATATPTP